VTNSAFIDHIANFFRECIAEMHRKNPDYAHQGVPLHDMFHQAFLEGVKPEQVLRILHRKHWTAIQAWTSGQSLKSETIHGRLQDSANYIGMMAMLSAEHGPELVDGLIDYVGIHVFDHIQDSPEFLEYRSFYHWLKRLREATFDRPLPNPLFQI
jgi:hypothetical protein